MNRLIRHALIVCALATALVACKKDEPAPVAQPAPTPPAQPAPPVAPTPPPAPAAVPVKVTDVQMSNAVGPDMRATGLTNVFKPADAIYAVVLTEGTGVGALGARWTYGADRQPVHEEEHKIDATGPGVHNFRITKPDGFPAGDYQVEIVLDGAVAATRDFKVE